MVPEISSVQLSFKACPEFGDKYWTLRSMEENPMNGTSAASGLGWALGTH